MTRRSIGILVVALFLAVLAAPLATARMDDATPSREERDGLQAKALRTWPPFVRAFRRALQRKDRAALRTLMAPDFWSWPAQMTGSEVAFRRWDDPYQNGWRAFDNLLRKRSTWVSDWYRNAGDAWRPMRIVPVAANRGGTPGAPVVPWYALFRYEEDGRWYCTVFSGCCDE